MSKVTLDKLNSRLGMRGVYQRLTDEQVAHYSKKLGRPLTPAEVVMGSLIRKPSAVFGSDQFRTRMLNASSDDPFEQEHQRALKAVEEEKVRRMTDAERTLFFVEQARAKRKQEQLSKQDHAAKLETFAPVLADIDRMLEEARFDKSYSFADIEALRDAREQILSEGACPVAAQELFVTCLATHTEKKAGQRAATASEMAKVQAEQARLQAQLEALDASLGNKRRSSSVTADQVDAARGEYERLKEADDAAKAISMRQIDAYKRYEKLRDDYAAANATDDATAAATAAE